jgi:chromosome segregation ATPase
MDNTTYQQIIGEIGTLISIFAPLLTAYKLLLALGFDKYIESKISLIKDDNLRKVAENIKIRVENLAVNTITMLEAVEKPQIISAIESGAMTKDDLKGLKAKAIETIKSQLSNEGQADLQNTVGDINSYLDTLIEAKLATLKVDPTSPVSKTEIPAPSQEELDNVSLRNQLDQTLSQLQQIQVERDNLSQQVSQISSDKSNIEQQLSQISNQVNDLTSQNQQLISDKQSLQNKFDALASTFNSVVQAPATQPQSVVDNTVQQVDANSVTPNTIQ